MTTHYMDEAERCHRLAFIFRGRLLDVGTPAEIVERRALAVVEIDVERATDAAEALRVKPDIVAVSSYGTTLRIATRARDARGSIRATLEPLGFAVRDDREVKPSVEDAFVSMVRDEATA
jgi:ABC-2 type transport system ATP-binding protein